MGFFGRMLGIEDETDRGRIPPPVGAPAIDPEARALERYRYMLRTAPPETLEQAHAEAFAKLTPEQRRQVLADLAQNVPPSERASVVAVPVDDPRALARVATRAEIRQPGLLERSIGSGAIGLGSSLLASFAMGFVGSMVAQSFLSALGGFGPEASAADPADGAPAEQDEGAVEGDDGDFGGDFDV